MPDASESNTARLERIQRDLARLLESLRRTTPGTYEEAEIQWEIKQDRAVIPLIEAAIRKENE